MTGRSRRCATASGAFAGFESALDGIVTKDDQSMILEFNSAAEAMFGLARQRTVGAKIRDVIISDRLRAAHDAGMARYVSTGDSRIVDILPTIMGQESLLETNPLLLRSIRNRFR